MQVEIDQKLKELLFKQISFNVTIGKLLSSTGQSKSILTVLQQACSQYLNSGQLNFVDTGKIKVQQKPAFTNQKTHGIGIDLFGKIINQSQILSEFIERIDNRNLAGQFVIVENKYWSEGISPGLLAVQVFNFDKQSIKKHTHRKPNKACVISIYENATGFKQFQIEECKTDYIILYHKAKVQPKNGICVSRRYSPTEFYQLILKEVQSKLKDCVDVVLQISLEVLVDQNCTLFLGEQYLQALLLILGFKFPNNRIFVLLVFNSGQQLLGKDSYNRKLHLKYSIVAILKLLVQGEFIADLHQQLRLGLTSTEKQKATKKSQPQFKFWTKYYDLDKNCLQPMPQGVLQNDQITILYCNRSVCFIAVSASSTKIFCKDNKWQSKSVVAEASYAVHPSSNILFRACGKIGSSFNCKIQYLDLEKGQWINLISLQKKSALLKRTKPGFCLTDKQAILLGGSVQADSSALAIFDLQSKKLVSFLQDPLARSLRICHLMAMKDKVFAFVGSTGTSLIQPKSGQPRNSIIYGWYSGKFNYAQKVLKYNKFDCKKHEFQWFGLMRGFQKVRNCRQFEDEIRVALVDGWLKKRDSRVKKQFKYMLVAKGHQIRISQQVMKQ